LSWHHPTPRVSVVAGFLQHWFFFPGMAECHNLLLSPSRKLALTKEKNGMEEDWEIEEEDGGWSDDEDQEARQAREFKKGLDRESDSNILSNGVLFKVPTLDLSEANIHPAKLTPIPRHVQSVQFKRNKSNSTSSLYVNSTLSAPNLEQVLWCMGTAIFYHTTAGHTCPNKQPGTFEIFDEHVHPMTKGVILSDAPTQKQIYTFIHTIFKVEKLPAECAILCLAYIERLMSKTKIILRSSTWRRVTLGALILASKVWEDQAVWNVDFLSVFPNMSVNDLGKLEKYFLELVDYNVSLKGSEYAKYYFELRELAEKDSKSFPLKPLTTLGAHRLEQRAIETERRVRKLQRTSSADSLPIKSPRAVIS